MLGPKCWILNTFYEVQSYIYLISLPCRQTSHRVHKVVCQVYVVQCFRKIDKMSMDAGKVHNNKTGNQKK